MYRYARKYMSLMRGGKVKDEKKKESAKSKKKQKTTQKKRHRKNTQTASTFRFTAQFRFYVYAGYWIYGVRSTYDGYDADKMTLKLYDVHTEYFLYRLYSKICASRFSADPSQSLISLQNFRVRRGATRRGDAKILLLVVSHSPFLFLAGHFHRKHRSRERKRPRTRS